MRNKAGDSGVQFTAMHPSPFPTPTLNRSHSGAVLGKFLAVGLIALLGGGGWWYLKHRDANAAEYQTIPVTRGDLVQAVTATGTINPVLNVQVGSQISGNIEQLFVDWNSPVKAGQVVAQIDASNYKAIVAQAEGDLASAQAGLELARLNAKRARELDERKAAPPSSLDQANASLHQAEALVKIKEGALDRARLDVQHCTIHSPIDGSVISRSVDVGQTVAASLSAPVIFTIANDLTKMQIDSNVAEADVGNIEVGQNVDFTVDAFPYRTFHGKVVQVRNAPITVQNVVSYDTVISVNNEDMKLKPGMTANASLIVANHENVLKLGAAALRFRMPESTSTGKAGLAGSGAAAGSATPGIRQGGGGHGRGGKVRMERTVYVLRGEKTEPEAVQIKVGISDSIFTEVLDGLNEGDRVVIGMTGGTATQSQPAGMANPFGGPRRF